MSHLSRLFSAIILAILLASCGTAANTGTPASPVPQTPLPSPMPTPTLSPIPTKTAHFKIGTSVQVANWLVTVSKVTVSNGSEFVKPKAGNRFLIVTVSLKNTSSREQNINPGYFTFRDANGFKYIDTYFDGARPAPAGKAEAGGLLSGDLVYEVPQAMQRFTLAFEASLSRPGQTIWDIAV